MSNHRSRTFGSPCLLVLVMVLVASTAAWGAAPGTPGRIAFELDVDGTTRIMLVNPDGSGLRPITPEDVSFHDPAFSPDGLELAASSEVAGESRLFVMDFDGAGALQLPGDAGFDYRRPSWSPDGTRLVFERIDRVTGDSDVWIANVDGSAAAALVTNPGDDGDPSWSPDGTRVAFVTDRDGNFEVYVIGVDGTGLANLTNNAASDGEPDWSPDGTHIAFDTDREGGLLAVWSMNADGTAPTRLDDGSQPAFSPAGTQLAFVGPDPEADLSVMNSDGTAATSIVSGPVASPAWQPIVAGDNQPPQADAGPDQAVECTSPEGATVTLDGSGSTDPDSTPELSDLTLHEWFEDFGTADEVFLGEGETLDVTFDLGDHVVTLQVTDSAGQTSQDDVLITVEDTTPPVLELGISPSAIWPPNHRMVDVHVEAHAEDVCGEAVVVLESVTSSEPDDGIGDGSTTDDIQGVEADTADFDFSVRAERAGPGSGRTYTATYVATDESGNEAVETAAVVVPHDQRKSGQPARPEAGKKGKKKENRGKP